ncbi:signal peptidase I [Candidatus Woesearchaeota archaeon]|nr:signal peptidase I [Candidatus Woesearchaeota archaeon]
MKFSDIRRAWKKIWYFIWEDNSIWSWIVNIVLAFILIKFVVYPGLGFALSTTHPIVAVVSGSMEHNHLGFNGWWEKNKAWYLNNNLTKEEFNEFSLKNGFYKGDIIVLKGKKPKDIKIGDIIVFQSRRPDPIIHRVVKKSQIDEDYYFQTKGDNNPGPIIDYRNINGNRIDKGASGAIKVLDETEINENEIIGKALFKIPLLGYIKIWFVEFVCLFNDFNFCIGD